MKSLTESLNESLLTKLKSDKSSAYFLIGITSIVNSYYDRGAKVSDDDKSLLEKLWKENDLEIPGMTWYFTHFEGLLYGPAIGLCVPIVQIHKIDDIINLSIHNRAGIDKAISDLNLSHWEGIAKKETKKMTDAFLRKYDKKLSNILNMKPTEGESEYYISRYELD